MKVLWENEKTVLEELIKDGVSYERIGKKYGVTGNSVKKAAKKLGIELPVKRKVNANEHFNKGQGRKYVCLNCGKEIKHGKYCSNACQHEQIKNEYIRRWKIGEENGITGEYNLSKHIRNYLLEKVGYRCEKCGWSEKNEYTNTIPLEIHHIDGDYTNNKEENLQVLCPNCHSLTETHKSHNKKGRKGRKKYSV